MSDRIKMLLRLGAFLGVCGLIAFALYAMFFRGTPEVTTDADDTTTTTNGSLPGSSDATSDSTDDDTDADDDADSTDGGGTLPPSQVADGGATVTTLLTNTSVLSPTATSGGALAYYDPADGRFYTVDEDGDVAAMSAQRFPEADTVTFASDASAAVLEFPDGSNVVYSFALGTQVTLPSHWEDFSFSGDGTEIASKSVGSDPSNRSIVVSSVDGSQTEVIAALGDNDDKVDVNMSPSGTVVGFSATGGAQAGFGRQELYLIGEDGEAAGNLIIEGSNFSAVWAPSGGYILYSVAEAANDYRPSLWYADARGDRKGTTRVRIPAETWVEKCVFASASALYCAVPVSVPDGAGSNHSLVDSADNLYAVSLPSGKMTLLGYTATEKQMFNLSLNSDGSVLYFQDENGRLNSMQLK